jgi:hypothetical protein
VLALALGFAEVAAGLGDAVLGLGVGLGLGLGLSDGSLDGDAAGLGVAAGAAPFSPLQAASVTANVAASAHNMIRRM